MTLPSSPAIPVIDVALAHPVWAPRVALAAILCVFGLAASVGGEAFDRELLPLVRFIALMMLIPSLYLSAKVSTRLAYSQKRWRAGQISAACLSIGAGLVWTGVAFGASFLFVMLSLIVGVLVVLNELTARKRRRRVA